MLAAQSCLTLCDPMDGKASLPVEFSREEYWSGLPFPSPGDLPNPGIKSGSPILQADSLPSERYQGSFLLSLNWKGEEEKRKGKGKKRKDCFWWIFHVQNCELPMCIGLHRAWVQYFSQHGKLSTWIWLVVRYTHFPEGKGCLISFCLQILTHSLTLAQSQTSKASWLNAHPADLHFLKHFKRHHHVCFKTS